MSCAFVRQALDSRGTNPLLSQSTVIMSQATTFWRLAGLSYLEFASKSTTVLRSALKEPARSAALARDSVSYNRNMFINGTPQGKVNITSLKEAASAGAN